MEKTAAPAKRPELVFTTMNKRRKHNLSEEKRIADHTKPLWWAHAHINTRAGDKPGTLAATHADLTTRTDFESYLEETRTMRHRSKVQREQHPQGAFSVLPKP